MILQQQDWAIATRAAWYEELNQDYHIFTGYHLFLASSLLILERSSNNGYFLNDILYAEGLEDTTKYLWARVCSVLASPNAISTYFSVKLFGEMIDLLNSAHDLAMRWNTTGLAVIR